MKRRDDGFSILELLVAVTIFAAIAVALAAAFRMTAGAMERGEEATMESARLRAAVEAVTRALRGADPAVLPAAEGAAIFFIGEPGRIRFLSSSPLGGAPGRGFRLLSFFAAPAGGGGEEPGGLAVSDASPFRPGGADGWDGSGEGLILLPGATDVVFAYSPGPSEEGTWEWREAWDGRESTALPAAVRVSFATPGADGPLTTSFVVALPAGAAHGG